MRDPPQGHPERKLRASLPSRMARIDKAATPPARSGNPKIRRAAPRFLRLEDAGRMPALQNRTFAQGKPQLGAGHAP